MNTVREQIQEDLLTLLESFGVGHLQNSHHQTLAELACQIVVDNFQTMVNDFKAMNSPKKPND